MPIVLYVSYTMLSCAGQRSVVRELPKERRPTEVSARLHNWQHGCRRRAYRRSSPLDIDVCPLSRVLTAP
jgi:hypothetical protein